MIGHAGARGIVIHILGPNQTENEHGTGDEQRDEPHGYYFEDHELARLVSTVFERKFNRKKAIHAHEGHVPYRACAKEDV